MRGSVVEFAALLVLTTGCTSPGPAADPAAEPRPAPALRYLNATMVDFRSIEDCPEVYLPDQKLACSITQEVRHDLGSHPMAHVWSQDAARNVDRDSKATPLQACEIPAPLVAQLVELAELTRRQREMAERVGRQIAEVLPLDSSWELSALDDECQRARHEGSLSAPAAEEFRQRARSIYYGMLPDSPKQLRELRGALRRQLAVPGTPQSSPAR